MTTTFCDSGAVKLKAGVAVSTALTDAQYTQLINQAESFINAATRINYVTTYSGLTAAKKYILEDAASCYAAVSAINYDLASYPSTAKSQTALDVNWAKYRECIKLLEDKKQTDFLTAA